MHFLSALFAVSSLFGAVQAVGNQGLITAPPNGTHIAPGQSFPFTYNTRNDHCLSSYNYTVWLLTSPPSNPMTLSTTGVFLGRFSDRTYFTNPNSTNPPPKNLTMPDFTARQRGWGEGKSATNLNVWLTVLEEWKECNIPQIGDTLTATNIRLVYNATSGE